jgi:uncharacterized protein (TIGR02594 family)
MSIRRIVTDIPQGRVKFVLALIREAGGTVEEQQTEPDGEVTIVALFPEPEPALVTAAAESPEFKWMEVARAELGQAEGGPGGSNPRIEAYHATTQGGADPDTIPWCSSFVNFCVNQAGFQGTNSKLARSWLGWGVEAREFVPGCIVVLARGNRPKGHVGFYVGSEGGNVRLLGGNQGDRVSIVSFPADRVIGRRVLA